MGGGTICSTDPLCSEVMTMNVCVVLVVLFEATIGGISSILCTWCVISAVTCFYPCKSYHIE